MIDYSNNYFKYLDSSEITDLDIGLIISSNQYAKTIFENRSEKDKEIIREIIRKIIKENIQNNDVELNLFDRSVSIAKELCKKVAELPNDDYNTIASSIYKILDNFLKNAKIDDITIPLIVFNGNDDELATIYQKLNQEGVKLSKYDVFAATWIDHTVTIKDDEEFIKLIIDKYNKSEELSSLEIANYDPDQMLETGELTVFEYAFAIGKALMKNSPKLFKKKNDDSKIESIGFIVLTELLGLPYQKMNLLADELSKYKNLDYKALKDAIIDMCSCVEKALGNYIVAPTKSSPSLACHSELQLASYIIVLFKLKYKITISDGLIDMNKGGKSKEFKAVEKNLYKHYLCDILRDFWSGSGDTKLEDIISDPKTCKYTLDVKQATFEQVVSDWLSSANKKSLQNAVSAESKLFYNYFLRNVLTDTEIKDECFDIEHCVPKKILKSHFIEKDTIIPISAPCNLTYIPKTDNRSKGEKTYYQKQKDNPKTYYLNESELNKLLYPNKQELLFVESAEDLTEENYFRFLNSRETVITNRIIQLLYK